MAHENGMPLCNEKIWSSACARQDCERQLRLAFQAGAGGFEPCRPPQPSAHRAGALTTGRRAQPGEHLLCKQGLVGPSPSSFTSIHACVAQLAECRSPKPRVERSSRSVRAKFSIVLHRDVAKRSKAPGCNPGGESPHPFESDRRVHPPRAVHAPGRCRPSLCRGPRLRPRAPLTRHSRSIPRQLSWQSSRLLTARSLVRAQAEEPDFSPALCPKWQSILLTRRWPQVRPCSVDPFSFSA